MDTIDHAIALQKKIDKLIAKIVATDGAGQSELLGELNAILIRMPKPTSKVCLQIAEAIIKVYQDQGFLEGEMYGGRSGDEAILNYYQRILQNLPGDVIRAYTKLNDEVINMLTRGDITSKQAVDVITNASDYRGLTVVHNGRNYQFDKLIASHVRNQLREATNRASDDIASMLNTNIFQVDSHAGARPLCAQDQGKLFSDKSGTYVDINDNKHRVYAWYESTMGNPAGLFGVNCRHVKYPMVPGFSIPSKEDPMLKVIKKNQNKVDK